MIELLIAMVMALFIGLAIYKLVANTSMRGVKAIQNTKTSIEVNKALDYVSMHLQNALAFPSAKFTLLGSIPNATTFQECVPFQVTYSGHSPNTFDFAPHGLVPLPGLHQEEIDLGGNLTILNPADPMTETKNDALRIAYIPKESDPIRVSLDDISNNKVEVDPTELANSNFHVGDYAAVFDHTRREMFRITRVGSDFLEHDPAISIWNLPFTEAFSMTTNVFVQKIALSTYAYSATTKSLNYDDHVFDDGFNPDTHVFDPMNLKKRVPHWIVATRNIRAFRVKYDLRPGPPPIPTPNAGSTFTRAPIAARAIKQCGNQLGYPSFKSVYLDVVVEPSTDEKKGTQPSEQQYPTLARRAASENLLKPAGTSSDDRRRDPIDYYPPPTPTPVPTATPAGGPGPGVTPPPTPIPAGGTN